MVIKSERAVVGMKKAIPAIVVICIIVALVPLASLAVATPYFVAVNDTLLPLNEDTMPFVSGGQFFVPCKVFSDAGVWSLTYDEAGRARLYRGSRHLDFFTTQGGLTMDQDGRVINCPSAQRIGNRFYVPLNQVCSYFELTYEIIEVDQEIIPNEQMSILRIKSNAVFPDKTFVGVNRLALKAAYDEYYAPAPSATQPASPPTNEPLPPPVELPPTYEDVTIYLSFCGVNAEGAMRIIEILDAPSASGYPSCFFISAAEIAKSPDLVRMISGSGHTVGIWLEKGTFEEYLNASALLFEAAKVKTVLVSSDETEVTAIYTADLQGLIFWGASRSFDADGDFAEEPVTDAIPTESGEKCNLMFSCTEESASMLPTVLAHLSEYEYTVARITETTMAGNN
jgi:hypothetical protein